MLGNGTLKHKWRGNGCKKVKFPSASQICQRYFSELKLKLKLKLLCIKLN